jgi:hypothetical protein
MPPCGVSVVGFDQHRPGQPQQRLGVGEDRHKVGDDI